VVGAQQQVRASAADLRVAVEVRRVERPRPQLEAGHVLLRVVACGVCRTDLHIVEGDLPALRPQLIPGHQIVGEVVEGATAELPLGTTGVIDHGLPAALPVTFFEKMRLQLLMLFIVLPLLFYLILACNPKRERVSFS